MKKLFLCLVAAAALGAPLAAADVQLIANPDVSVSELSAGDVRDIFLGSKTAVGGGAVEPVFVEAGAAHQLFLKTYLAKSDAALRNHFKALVFTGKGVQPKTFDSDAEVVRYVSRTRGAIGYVSGGADMSAVKKIQVK